MARIWEKAISILAGNLNSGRSYLITAVSDKKFEICTDLKTNNIANTYEDHITEQKLYWQGKNALLELKKLIFQSYFLSFLL